MRVVLLYPAYWKKLRLAEIGAVVTGTTPSTKNKEYYGGEYKLISPANLDNGKYVSTWHKSLSKTGFAKCKALPKDSILVGCIGNVGKIGMTPDEKAATNQQINALVCRSSYDPHFIYYCLVFNRPNLEKAAVKTTVPILNKSNFEDFEILVPPLPEQRKIAAVLSLVQRAIEQQERLIALTTELKKALMHKLFTEGVRGEPQKMTEIGPVPESWEVVELGEVLELAQYGLSKKGVELGNYPILRMTNQVNGRIVSNDLQWVKIDKEEFRKFAVEKGDILFNRTNSFELVGRTAIFDIEGDYVFASYLIRLRLFRSRLNPFFLNFYFNSDETQVRLKSIATRAVSQSNISATRLKGFLIPLPEMDEQVAIINILDVLDSKVNIHEQKRSSLQSLFHSLLHQLMTGQRRVHEIHFENIKEKLLIAAEPEVKYNE